MFLVVTHNGNKLGLNVDIVTHILPLEEGSLITVKGEPQPIEVEESMDEIIDQTKVSFKD